AIGGFADARVGVTAHHNGLQFRRVPGFGDDVNRAFVADFACRNGEGGTGAFRFNALYHLLAKFFVLGFMLDLIDAEASAVVGDGEVYHPILFDFLPGLGFHLFTRFNFGADAAFHPDVATFATAIGEGFALAVFASGAIDEDLKLTRR